ncbi:MAG: TonB-dependent receptor [Draconibacterium sp.]
MKLYWFAFLVLVLLAHSSSWGQNSLNLNVRNISMQDLFNKIENETGYRFFYNNDEVDVTYIVTLNVSGRTVTEILDQIFGDLPYSYRELENKLILIEAKKGKLTKVKEQVIPKRKIFGRVIDDKGKPVPGVSIAVKGTVIGTVAGTKGEYDLELPANARYLVFSFVGMRTQEIPLTEKEIYNITLREEAIGLNEIVVIGYGTVKKSDLTGSVAVVSAEELNRVPSSNFSNALQGRASGVIVSQSGTPGGTAQIRVRGIGSINQSPNPIYVIDGVITGSLGSVNPTDIETIQVLKDASASAIYGADGANGVIIITTKRGEKGKPKVSLSSFLTMNRVPKQFDVMDANEYADFYSTLLTESGISVPVSYTDGFRQLYYGSGWEQGTQWQDEINRTALGQNHNLRVSGGGESSNYSISLNYFSEEGILLASSSDRYSMRANSDFDLGKYIKIGETLSVARFETQTPSTWEGNPWQVSLIATPLMRMYNENNKGGFEGPQIPYEYETGGITEIVSNTGYNDKPNPRGPMEMGNYMSYNTNVLASIYFELKPVSWLRLKTTPSAEVNFSRTKNWLPAFDMGVRSNAQAQLDENYYEGVLLSLENQLSFMKDIGDHTLSGTVVQHVRKSDGNSVEVTAQGFPYEQLNVISQSYEDGRQVKGYYSPFASESYLGRLIYDYGDKYLLTASIRYDGNSRFGPANRWGSFPSLSAAWKVNEDFLQGLEELNLLKFRFGWGMTGNSNIGSFQYQSVIDNFDQFSPVFGADQKLVPALNVVHSFGNPSIKWEAAEMLNFGADINLFNNKVQLSAEYYIKNQDDLLVKIPVSSAFGRVSGAGDPWVNLGEIQNKGFEFNGTYSQAEGDFRYNISANFTTVKNRVKYIPGDILSGNNLTTLSHTIGSFYGYIAEGILMPTDFDLEGNYLHAMPATGKPSEGDLMFKDLNRDGTINDLDRTIIGKSVPDFIYSLNLEGFYRNFDVSVFFYGMQNYDVYNHLRASVEGFSSQDMGHNKLVSYADNYYRPERPSTKYIRADMNNTNQNDRASTWFLEDGSFLRLKDLQVGYSLPEYINSYLGLSRARFYVSATNLWTMTKYTGRDPESPTIGSPLTPGNDNGSYPVPRSFTVGVQVDF